jgi:hypothetical protein
MGDLGEQLVPGHRVVVQPHHLLEPGDGRLTVHVRQPGMDRRLGQDVPDGGQQLAPPEGVAATGGHAHGGHEGGVEAGVEQAVVVCRVVQVGGDGDGEDGFEVRRLFHRGFQLGHREVADADHAHRAVAPGLGGGPLHDVVQVAPLLPVEEPEGAIRATGGPQVHDDLNVAARYEEIARPGLDETQGGAEVLDLTGVGGGGDQGREAALPVRSVHVGEQPGPVPHADLDVLVGGHREARFGQLPVVPTGRLRAVEPALAGTDSG